MFLLLTSSPKPSVIPPTLLLPLTPTPTPTRAARMPNLDRVHPLPGLLPPDALHVCLEESSHLHIDLVDVAALQAGRLGDRGDVVQAEEDGAAVGCEDFI